MTYDVIVIGGSYAGMAAALQLVRARRRVLVVDARLRRNRFASHSYGFLSQDGTSPADIARLARQQLEVYPTLTWIDGLTEVASGEKDGFAIRTKDGVRYEGRRIVLAIGVSDELPAIEGLKERFGVSVFHCPYCHGYELNQGRIAVIATGPMSLHQAQLIPEWGDVTFFTNDALVFDDNARSDLSRRGVIVEETPIVRLAGSADIIVRDGRQLSFDGIFTAPRNAPATAIAETLGCTLVETPVGVQIGTDDTKETSIPGVFACGDAARVPHSLSLAVADGAWAGAQVHRSLIWT